MITRRPLSRVARSTVPVVGVVAGGSVAQPARSRETRATFRTVERRDLVVARGADNDDFMQSKYW
jgi:hypothetical protein